MQARPRVLGRAGKIIGPAAYVLAVLILFQFFSIQIVLAFYENPLPQDAALAAQTTKPLTTVPTAVGLPIRLIIPRIHVNAPIDDVGLTADGSMGIPKLPLNAAWYALGPKPGEAGNAVIDGHLDWWYGAKGVFEYLSSLKPGDLITVQDSQGATTTFVVRTSRAYGQKDNDTAVFQSSDGKSHLNLITCDGVWDRKSQMYSKRLVVFADKVVK
ncbi:MAG: class F sortase [Patescibacteria group bacterium]